MFGLFVRLRVQTKLEHELRHLVRDLPLTLENMRESGVIALKLVQRRGDVVDARVPTFGDDFAIHFGILEREHVRFQRNQVHVARRHRHVIVRV